MHERIIEIISEINPFVEVGENTDFIEEEVLDSLGIMALISELERAFGVKIDLGTVELDDFRTMASIMKLIGE